MLENTENELFKPELTGELFTMFATVIMEYISKLYNWDAFLGHRIH